MKIEVVDYKQRNVRASCAKSMLNKQEPSGSFFLFSKTILCGLALKNHAELLFTVKTVGFTDSRVNEMINTSKLNLLDLINENNVQPELDEIRVDEIEFSVPEVVSVVGEDGELRTTKVVVTSKIPGDDSAPIPVFYNRRSLPDYLPADTTLEKDEVETSHDVLWQLADNYDVVIPPEDLESTPVVSDVLTIRPKTTSVEWCGEVDVKLVESIDLSAAITVTELTGLNYPDHDDPAIGQAQVYTYDLDCTYLSYFLNILAPGVEFDDTALAVSLNTVGSDIWVAVDELAPFNLRGSSVVFEGSPSELEWGNEQYQKVISILLGPLCSNIQGQLNLHYDPIEGGDKCLVN